MNLLPIWTGQIKDRADDWAVEAKGVTGGLREYRRRRWKEDGAEPHSLEESQVARGLTARE